MRIVYEFLLQYLTEILAVFFLFSFHSKESWGKTTRILFIITFVPLILLDLGLDIFTGKGIEGHAADIAGNVYCAHFRGDTLCAWRKRDANGQRIEDAEEPPPPIPLAAATPVPSAPPQAAQRTTSPHHPQRLTPSSTPPLHDLPPVPTDAGPPSSPSSQFFDFANAAKASSITTTIPPTPAHTKTAMLEPNEAQEKNAPQLSAPIDYAAIQDELRSVGIFNGRTTGTFDKPTREAFAMLAALTGKPTETIDQAQDALVEMKKPLPDVIQKLFPFSGPLPLWLHPTLKNGTTYKLKPDLEDLLKKNRFFGSSTTIKFFNSPVTVLAHSEPDRADWYRFPPYPCQFFTLTFTYRDLRHEVKGHACPLDSDDPYTWNNK